MATTDKEKNVSLKKTATIKDIAQRAGVSIGTVDRALNNRSRISAATKEKILQAAMELDYKRNEFARALSVKKRVHIVAVYPTIPDYYTHYFTEGFNQAASQLIDYGLEFSTLRTKTLNPHEILLEITKLNLDDYDGILINASGMELNSFINETVDRGIAVATFNSDLPGNKRLFFSGEDHIVGGRMSGELAARLLRSRGTVGLVCGLPSIYAHEQRIEGFKEVLANHYPDVDISRRVNHDDIPEHLSEKAEELLFEGAIPDIIFCNSATGVSPICRAIERHKPQNKPLVIGYDYDHTLQPLIDSGTCTALVFQNPRKQAYNALRFLFSYIYEKTGSPAREDSIIMPTIVMKYNVDICK